MPDRVYLSDRFHNTVPRRQRKDTYLSTYASLAIRITLGVCMHEGVREAGQYAAIGHGRKLSYKIYILYMLRAVNHRY